jgi:beta-glucanase (GH16 family)
MIHSNVVVGPDQAQGGRFISSDRNFNKQWYYYKAPFRFTDDFHVFGALWDTDDTISIYVDGRLIQKRAYKWTNPSAVPGFAHVLVNLAIGGDWAGRYGIDDSAFPQALEVDYVRVYQRPDAVRMGDDTRGNPKLCAVPAEC